MKKVASVIIIIIGLLSIVLLVSLGKELFNRFKPVHEVIRVSILNGTSIDGLAARTAEYLKKNKCDVLQIGNASSVYKKTVIIDRFDMGLENARHIRELLHVGEITYEADQGHIIQVTIILGDDYKPLE